MLIVHFKNWKCKLETSTYQNGRIALLLVDIFTSETIAVATVNLPYTPLPYGYVFINDYSENEGVFKALKAARILNDHHIDIPTGYTITLLCRFTSEFMDTPEFKNFIVTGNTRSIMENDYGLSAHDVKLFRRPTKDSAIIKLTDTQVEALQLMIDGNLFTAIHGPAYAQFHIGAKRSSSSTLEALLNAKLITLFKIEELSNGMSKYTYRLNTDRETIKSLRSKDEESESGKSPTFIIDDEVKFIDKLPYSSD